MSMTNEIFECPEKDEIFYVQALRFDSSEGILRKK